MSSPVPKGWTRQVKQDGAVVYVHAASNIATTALPSPDTEKKMREYAPLPDGWARSLKKDGSVLFTHAAAGLETIDFPTANTEMKMRAERYAKKMAAAAEPKGKSSCLPCCAIS
jgi:hypothetical protein